MMGQRRRRDTKSRRGVESCEEKVLSVSSLGAACVTNVCPLRHTASVWKVQRLSRPLVRWCSISSPCGPRSGHCNGPHVSERAPDNDVPEALGSGGGTGWHAGASGAENRSGARAELLEGPEAFRKERHVIMRERGVGACRGATSRPRFLPGEQCLFSRYSRRQCT